MVGKRKYAATVAAWWYRAGGWLFCALTVPLLAANWPAWRGPAGNGIATETNLPLHWNTNENVRWSERLVGSGARSSSMSSPVLAGDRLYLPNRNADVFVLRAGPKFELLAINSIGGEPMIASLAVSGGDIFIRTDKNLWCIGQRRD